jgi:hypothetical protein
MTSFRIGPIGFLYTETGEEVQLCQPGPSRCGGRFDTAGERR